MDFFDKIGKKASEAYKVTADKTGKIAKETKIKFEMGKLKTKINDYYEEIGKLVYEKHLKKGKVKETAIEDICVEIDVLTDEIYNMEKECLDLKDKKQCPNCYEKIEKDSKYCPNCGQKQEETENEETNNDEEIMENQVEIDDLEIIEEEQEIEDNEEEEKEEKEGKEDKKD